MNQPTIARGNKTRQSNKELRRQRILDIAKDQIANNGFEAFTIKDLAAKAEVTIPTVHNLFGKKNDIFKELFTEMLDRTGEVPSKPTEADPIQAITVFMDNLLTLYASDEAFYRASFVAGERIGLFEHDSPSGIYNKSLRIAEGFCQKARDDGFLRGDIDVRVLAEQIFNCQRIARHDWIGGYIDLAKYRTQVLTGVCIIYAADATPGFHKELSSAIKEISV